MTSADAVPGIGEAAYARAALPFGEVGAMFSAYAAGTAYDVRISSDADPAMLLEAATTLGRTLFERLP